MALDFQESWDQYGSVPFQTTNQLGSQLPLVMLQKGWIPSAIQNDGGNGFAIGTAWGRFPGSCGLYVNSQSSNRVMGFNPPLYGNNQTEYCAFSVYFEQVPLTSGLIALVGFFDQNSEQITFFATNTNQIAIYKGGYTGTLLATSAGTFTSGQWYRIETKVTIDPAAGTAEMKVNGSVFVTFSGNTRQTANSYSNRCILGSYAWSGSSQPYNLRYDDFILYNSGGSAPNGYLGDKRAIYVAPNGAGDVTNFTKNFASWTASQVMVVGQQIKDSNNNVQRVTAITSDAKTGGSPPTWATTGGNTTTDNHVTWTVVGSGANPGNANWMAVAEAPPDYLFSYNSDSTVGDKDRFVGAGVPSTIGGITLVAVEICAQKDDAGPCSMRASMKGGGVEVDDGVDHAVSGGANGAYLQPTPFFLTDPTGAAWTATNVNSLTGWGYKRTA